MGRLYRRIVRWGGMLPNAGSTLVLGRVHSLVTPSGKMRRVRASALHRRAWDMIFNEGFSRHVQTHRWSGVHVSLPLPLGCGSSRLRLLARSAERVKNDGAIKDVLCQPGFARSS
jgi:hypothetical protein